MNPLRQQPIRYPSTLECAANEVGAADITSNSAMASGLSTTEAILAHMPGMVYRAVVYPDRSIGLSYVSEGIHTLTGLFPEEVIAHSHRFYTMIHPEDRAAFGAALERSLANLHAFQHEYRLITPDGNVKWIMDRARLICSPDGSIILDGVCVDMGECADQASATHRPWPKRYNQFQLAEQRRREWIEFLSSLSQRLPPSLMLNEIVTLIAHDVRTFLQVDRIVITPITPDGYLNNTAESIGSGWSSVMGQALEVGWSRDDIAAFGQGHILVIEDVDQLSGCPDLVRTLRQHQVKAGVFVPILMPQGLWGLLSIHHCLTVHPWSLTDLDFLKQLSAQISVAIQHSESYHQIQRLNSELERKFQARTAQLELAFEFEATLKRITDKVRDSLDEDQILQTAVQELAIAIGVSGCNAALYDLEQGTSTVCYEYTTTVSPSQGRVAHMKAFPEIYGQLFNGIAFQFCSVVPNPVRGHVAMLTCPILDDQGVLGDLWLINHKFYAFSEQDIRLVQQVANQCAIALRQARLYKAAQVQVAELERLNHLKDDFLSRVSHELRTPIASIKMASQMLEISLNQAGLLAPETNPFTRYLNILQGECQREMSLVNDLLDLSRLEAQAEPLQLTSMPLQDWISELVEPFVDKLEKQSQQLQVHMPASMTAVVSDFPKLSRILAELLQNASKYTPSGKTITVSAQVLRASQGDEISALIQPLPPQASQKTGPTRDKLPAVASFALLGSMPLFSPPSGYGSFLRLQVSNSGVEIPVQERSRIFEKFYRIPNAQDPWRHGGTGLGLALVKKLVEQLQGQIDVFSEQEVTTFTVQIPLHRP